MKEWNYDFSDVELNKLYPNRRLFKTSKSEFDIQFETARKEAAGKKGISFYCPKRDRYIFIENTK